MRRWARGGRTPISSSAPATAPSAQLHRADRTRGEDSERSGHCNAERGGRPREGSGRTDAEGEGGCGGGGARRRRGQDEGEERGAAGDEARRRRRRRLRVRGPPEGRGRRRRRRTAAERWPRRRWTRWRGERVDGAHWAAHCEGILWARGPPNFETDSKPHAARLHPVCYMFTEVRLRRAFTVTDSSAFTTPRAARVPDDFVPYPSGVIGLLLTPARLVPASQAECMQHPGTAWQGSGSFKNSFGSGSSDGAASLVELEPF